MKKLIKKLNNYRVTALAVGITAAFVALLTIGLVLIYYFANGLSNTTGHQIPSFSTIKQTGRILQMVFFIFAIIVLALSLGTAYLLVPAILNKGKVVPSKTPLFMAAVTGVLQIVLLVFSILAITLETPKVAACGALYIVTIPLNIISLVANIFYLVPAIKCEFYMPEVGK